MGRKTEKEISDEVAADALRYGSKSGSVPTHSGSIGPYPAVTDADENEDFQDEYFDDDANEGDY
jgi:hypothetical protein